MGTKVDPVEVVVIEAEVAQATVGRPAVDEGRLLLRREILANVSSISLRRRRLLSSICLTSSSQSRKRTILFVFLRLSSLASSRSIFASRVSRRKSSLRNESVPASKLFFAISSSEKSTKDLEYCWTRRTSIRVECSQSAGRKSERM